MGLPDDQATRSSGAGRDAERTSRVANATVVSGDALDVVARLKDESTVPLRSTGSVAINRALMAAGLVDFVRCGRSSSDHPKGKSGEDPIVESAQLDLELVESRTLDRDIQELVYQPDAAHLRSSPLGRTDPIARARAVVRRCAVKWQGARRKRSSFRAQFWFGAAVHCGMVILESLSASLRSRTAGHRGRDWSGLVRLAPAALLARIISVYARTRVPRERVLFGVQRGARLRDTGGGMRCLRRRNGLSSRGLRVGRRVHHRVHAVSGKPFGVGAVAVSQP